MDSRIDPLANAEKHCPICGKIFYVLSVSDWGYRGNKSEFFCSYGCKRKSEAAKERKYSKIREEKEYGRECLHCRHRRKSDGGCDISVPLILRTEKGCSISRSEMLKRTREKGKTK